MKFSSQRVRVGIDSLGLLFFFFMRLDFEVEQSRTEKSHILAYISYLFSADVC